MLNTDAILVPANERRLIAELHPLGEDVVARWPRFFRAFSGTRVDKLTGDRFGIIFVAVELGDVVTTIGSMERDVHEHALPIDEIPESVLNTVLEFSRAQVGQ